jgi:hypothetical protein
LKSCWRLKTRNLGFVLSYNLSVASDHSDFESPGAYLRRLQLRDDNRRELVFGVTTPEQEWEAECRMVNFLAALTGCSRHSD